MDPWSKLIRRAQAFRDTLVQASADTTASCGKPTRRINEQREMKNEACLLRNLLAEESPPFAKQREEEEEGKEEGLNFDLLTSLLDQEQPGDVAEEALLEELFFPANKEVPLPSSKRKQSDLCLDRNTLCLIVNVGKLLFCQPIGEFNCRLDAGMETDDSSSSCLLTLTFPAITSEKLRVGSAPEQCISIMPTKASGNEFFFEHQSQLFWKLPSDQLPSSIWDAQQMMKVSVKVTVPEAETLHGKAYLPLQNVVKQMFSMLQLNMVLVGSDRVTQNSRIQVSHGINGEQKHHLRTCQKKEVCMMPGNCSQNTIRNH